MGYHDGGKKNWFARNFFGTFFCPYKKFWPPGGHLPCPPPGVHPPCTPPGGPPLYTWVDFFFPKKIFPDFFFGGPKFTPFSVAISVLEKKKIFTVGCKGEMPLKDLAEFRKSPKIHFWTISYHSADFDPFWTILDHFRSILTEFGPILDNFGPFWTIFVDFGPIWKDFEGFWSILYRIWPIFGPFGLILDRFWTILGRKGIQHTV